LGVLGKRYASQLLPDSCGKVDHPLLDGACLQDPWPMNATPARLGREVKVISFDLGKLVKARISRPTILELAGVIVVGSLVIIGAWILAK